MTITGGGKYDPAGGNVFFCAGSVDAIEGASKLYDYVLIALNEINNDGTRKRFEALLDNPRLRIMLDSGIYWMTNQHARAHGIGMDEALRLPPDRIDGFPELWDRYTELVPEWEDRLWGYIELDQGGADAKRETRRELEALGLKPMPVYHPLLDGWEYFDELAGGYDRICFGNVVTQRAPERLRLLATMEARRRAYPHLWIHVLGMSATHMTFVYGPSSCDSSSWLSAARWAQGTYAYAIAPVYLKGLDFRYEYGAHELADNGFDRSWQLAVFESRFQMESWRHHLAEWDEVYPQPTKRKG